MARSLCRTLYKLPRISFSTFTGIKFPSPNTTLPCRDLLKRPNVGSPLHTQHVRWTSFLVRYKASQLWKSLTSVSNAGKNRGRGKGAGKKFIKDFNRGQVIGVGRENMVWPGLTCPVIKGKEKVELQQLPPDVDYDTKLAQLRDQMNSRKSWRMKLTPLERGWSGVKLGGRSIGLPDPVGDETFEGFDTKVLEHKIVTNMSGTFGRVRRFSVLAVLGNGNGLGGFSLAKSPTARSALQLAKNRSRMSLLHVDLFENRTLQHNFFAQYGRTKIFAFKKPEGFGLVCHRCLKTICQVIGIKDMYAKVEGAQKNYQNLTKAFFHGLMHMKNFQSMADEVGLNIVEFQPHKSGLPRIIASPINKLSPEEQAQKKKKFPSYKEYLSEGRVALRKKKRAPFYVGTWGWEIHQRRTYWRRNHAKVRIRILAERERIGSYLNDLPEDQLPPFDGIGKPQYTKSTVKRVDVTAVPY